jgi:hypothetical protein
MHMNTSRTLLHVSLVAQAPGRGKLSRAWLLLSLGAGLSMDQVHRMAPAWQPGPLEEHMPK